MLLMKQILEYIFARKEVYSKTLLATLQAGKLQWEYLPDRSSAVKKKIKKSYDCSYFPILVRMTVLFVAEIGRAECRFGCGKQDYISIQTDRKTF